MSDISGSEYRVCTNKPFSRTLTVGELEAQFLPDRGMLGASLRHRGVEILGREDLDTSAAKGSYGRHPAALPLGEPVAGSG